MIRWLSAVLMVFFLPWFLGGTQGWSQTMQARQDMGKMFQAMDKNQDGKVTKEEYRSVWPEKYAGEENFRFFDKNGDGTLTQDEFLHPSGTMEQPGMQTRPQRNR
ncbi:EF-hand domain-containing protein [Desulfobacca acetoxidans]|nr:hypothetical protein [Desulfobacterales bacterium]